MYYQVLIETNEKIGKSKTSNKKIYELDKSNKEEIINDIIVPYLQKHEFQFDGYFLKSSDVVRIVVKTTEKSARELAQYENDNMTPGIIMYIEPKDILEYQTYVSDITKHIFQEASMMIDSNQVNSKTQKKLPLIDKTKVFIVHGRDNEAKIEVARFIEKLGFEPIILHEQASNGMTIIEKIESYSNVGFGIVLYTPCDIGASRDNQTEIKSRARQNVVFEHGYLIGKIGRNNVCALIKDELEKPNDISGVVYITMDAHCAWHIGLGKEMKSAGYDVDMNLII